MRRGTVELWDVNDDYAAGQGYVESSDADGIVCKHKWVLDRGYRFSPAGLAYQPQPKERDAVVGLGEAEGMLSARWRSDSRLVVCEARLRKMPEQTNFGLLQERAVLRPSARERIELRGVWIVADRQGTIGFVLVPDVVEFGSEAASDPALVNVALLQGKSVRLRLQNRYSEHWVLMNEAFPLLDKRIVVSAANGWAPQEGTFFEQLVSRLGPAGSYTEVDCATWVETT